MQADDLPPHRRHTLAHDIHEGMPDREFNPPDPMLWDLLPHAVSDG